MAQNVTIAGASYLGVPRIEMPKTGGGTAVFVDTSDANAAAGDITKGKTAYVGGTKITGTLEASPAGGAKETWVIKSDAAGELVTTQISFTSNGQKFTSIGADYADLVIILYYDNNEIAGFDPGAGYGFEFYNEAYRKLTFDTPPTGALLTWLQSNAVKQPDDTAVQDTKALTITSNGTVSVTPDAPYDAPKKVDVTVNVASGGGGSTGFKVTFPATAANWNKVVYGGIVQADGNLIYLSDYSVLAGKTIPNVVEIRCIGSGSYMLRMSVQTGRIIVTTMYHSGSGIRATVTNAGGVTATMMSNGGTTSWLFAEDTVISAIEMYNTD